jgi:hypothetical protein
VSYPNRDGAEGALRALQASNPAVPVGIGALVGPDAGATEGTQDPAGAGPGALLDGALAGLSARITALEQGEGGDAA